MTNNAENVPGAVRGPGPGRLHAAVARAAATLARRPARPQDIGRLAVDTVRRVDLQLALDQLVHPGRAHVGVEPGEVLTDPLIDRLLRDGKSLAVPAWDRTSTTASLMWGCDVRTASISLGSTR